VDFLRRERLLGVGGQKVEDHFGVCRLGRSELGFRCLAEFLDVDRYVQQ
jgi:hypothetical protein